MSSLSYKASSSMFPLKQSEIIPTGSYSCPIEYCIASVQSGFACVIVPIEAPSTYTVASELPVDLVNTK